MTLLILGKFQNIFSILTHVTIMSTNFLGSQATCRVLPFLPVTASTIEHGVLKYASRDNGARMKSMRVPVRFHVSLLVRMLAEEELHAIVS